MKSNQIAKGILQAIGTLVGIALTLYFLFKIKSVIAYVAIAAVISLIGQPIISALSKRLKFNRTLAVVITMVLFITAFLGIIGMFIPLIIEQGQNLSLLNIDQLQQTVERVINEVVAYFEIENFNLKNSILNTNFIDNFNFTFIPEFLNSVIGGLGNFSIGLFSVLFISFFFLKDSNLFQEGILALVPKNSESRTVESFNKIKGLLSRYFVGLLFQILILFIIYTIILVVFGINNALVIAFLCALLNLIPYLGPVVSAVLMLILSMSSNLGQSFSEVVLPTTIYIMIGFLIAQLIDNFISQPYIFSKSVKSHPLEIFLIIIIAGIVFGIWGMVIAVPTYTAIKVILKEFLNDNKIVQKLTQNL